jgi:hypothetical protein
VRHEREQCAGKQGAGPRTQIAPSCKSGECGDALATGDWISSRAEKWALTERGDDGATREEVEFAVDSPVEGDSAVRRQIPQQH